LNTTNHAKPANKSTSRVLPFRKDQSPQSISTAQEKITSCIAKTAVFVGDLQLSEGVKVDGRVQGNVIIASESSCMLFIETSGTIEGNVIAPRAFVCGTIKGNITATEIMVRSTAVIEGNINYHRLLMEDGATVNGTLNKASDVVSASTDNLKQQDIHPRELLCVNE
jgi:cytoskeletal protein CcmA (bactofilin family)